MTETDRKPDKIDLDAILGTGKGSPGDLGEVEILDPVTGRAAPRGGTEAEPSRGAAGPDPEREKLQDLYVRTRADFDNYRKRVEREREEDRARAGAALMKDLLPVLDNLERALSTAPPGEPFRDGVALIHRQLLDALSRAGLEPLPALGEPFDPVYHEAVATEPTDQFEPNIVLEELQKGYKVGGRVLRPAAVRVSAPARGTGARGAGGASEEGADADAS